MVDQQELEHALARLLGLLALHVHHLALGHLVTHAGISFGAFSTSTRHIRQTAGEGSDGW